MIRLDIIGNLGKDANQNTVNGSKVINFSVAHTEKFKDKDGNKKERTTWVECNWWSDKNDAILPYLKKGTQVFATGTPDIREWESQDGKKGSSLTLRVYSVNLLGSADGKKSNNSGDSSKATEANQQTTQTHIPDPNNNKGNWNPDDLPF